MGITVTLWVVLLILPGEKGLIGGQGPIGGEGGNDCCPFVSVNMGAPNEDLDGFYTLKNNQGSKPEEVCINGCVYTKDGSPSTNEYCFKQDDVAGADIKCQVKLCKCLLLNIVLSYIVCPNISDINHHVDEALVNLVLELRQQRRAEINLKRRRRSSIQVPTFNFNF